MVLRGAQFRPFGSAGCALPTKQASSSDITALTHWSIGPCLISRSHIASRHWIPWTATGVGDKGLACHGARERDLCHGHIGES